jgi:plastocyanin
MRGIYIGMIAAGVGVGACSSGDGPPTGNTQTGTIAGQVIDADSGNSGVSGVSVQLAGPAGTQTVTTGAGGGFSVANVATGAWTATLQLPASYRLAANETGTRSSTVTASQTTTLAMFLMARPKGSVTGTATEGSIGIAGGTVEATRPGFTAHDATPTAAGYTIADLSAGPWSLEYTPPETHDLVSGESGTRTVTIAESATATASAFELEAAAEVVEIRLNGTSFEGGTITIAAGTTVRWIYESGGPHTVTPENSSQTGVWQAQTMSTQGQVFEHTFSAPSQTYRYRCEPHSTSFTSGMVGVITVE